MAFYTPSWVRKLLKEEATEIAEYVSKGKMKNGKKQYDNDFRSYVDGKMPFVLFLDIAEIEQKVILPNSSLISQYIKQAFPTSTVKDLKELNTWFTDILRSCYVQVINMYIADSTYTDITDTYLNELLTGLDSTNTDIRQYINKHFSTKYRVSNITKKDKSVLLLHPSFIQAQTFGPRFSKILEAALKEVDKGNRLIQLPDGDYIENPYFILRELVEDKTGIVTGKKQQFTTQLYNLGHIELDVIQEADKTVKRGQLSPRFIQALATVPKAQSSRLALQFSKETGQAQTRVMIRKKFSGKKMVFEMLLEYGFPVGIPESQLTNLRKATGELAFGPGRGLSEKIRNNPDLLVSLETSKSIKQYLIENISSVLLTGKQAQLYTSEFNDIQKAVFTKTKVVKVKTPKSSNSNKKPVHKLSLSTKPETLNLTNLQNLLNQRLHDQIKQNMGTGSAKNVLNYRSGRLAQSAKVERLSESRAGMLQVFYTYMKYPYATFQDGGLQQSPKSRDPKLLISKSIREIAGTVVANRMRAINV